MKKTLVLLSALVLPFSALADWTLDSDSSSLNFISIKKGTAAETHSFKTVTGSINDSGIATITIKLASVETNIPIRNERMNSMLFNVSQFPEAVITSRVNLAGIKSMKPGEMTTQSVTLNVDLHGQKQSIQSDMNIVKLADNKVLAETISPVIVKAEAFEMAAGIEKLREVAKLPSISTAVPVTASLVFSK